MNLKLEILMKELNMRVEEIIQYKHNVEIAGRIGAFTLTKKVELDKLIQEHIIPTIVGMRIVSEAVVFYKSADHENRLMSHLFSLNKANLDIEDYDKFVEISKKTEYNDSQLQCMKDEILTILQKYIK